MAYEIDISSKKIDAITDSLEKAAAMAGNLDKAMKGVGETIDDTRTLQGRPASMVRQGGGPIGGGYSGYSGPSDSVNPYTGGGSRQRLMREQEGLRRSEAIGDADLIEDQRAKVRRAEARVAADDRLLNPAPIDARSGRSSSIDPNSFEGPRAKTRRLQYMADRAEASGDADTAIDLRAQIRRTQKRIAADEKLLDDTPQKAKTQEDLFREMMMSSRIGADGKIYPLVSKLLAAGGSLSTPAGAEAAAGSLKALGIGQSSDLAPAIAQAAKLAMPALIGVGAAALGTAAVVTAAEAGSARMRVANTAFYTMGGSPGDVGSAMALGGENAASKALQFGDRLREGSYGSAFFRSRGIMDLGPAQIDKSNNYVRALDALRGEPDIQKRIRIARESGLTEDLWTSDISSNGLYNRLKGSMGDAGSLSERRTEADYQARKGIAGNAWNRAVRVLGEPAMGYVGDTLGAAEGDWESAKGALGRAAKFGLHVATGGLSDSLFGAVDAYQKSKSKDYGEPQESPTKGGSQGFQKNIDPVMGKGRAMINGEGGAIPAGFRGSSMNNALNDQARHLGAWVN